jgi:hypothetical protein
LFLLPEDVEEGFADVAEEGAEGRECEAAVVEAATEVVEAVRGVCKGSFEGREACFVGG